MSVEYEHFECDIRNSVKATSALTRALVKVRGSFTDSWERNGWILFALRVPKGRREEFEEIAQIKTLDKPNVALSC